MHMIMTIIYLIERQNPIDSICKNEYHPVRSNGWIFKILINIM